MERGDILLCKHTQELYEVQSIITNNTNRKVVGVTISLKRCNAPNSFATMSMRTAMRRFMPLTGNARILYGSK